MDIQKTKLDNAYSIKLHVERDGKVVGWAFLIVLKTDRHTEPHGVMENVYVEQEYRGQGIGTALVEALIEEAKAQGCYKLLGQSRYSKPEVHALYERFGFKDWGKNFRMDLKESEIKQRD